MSEQPPVTYPEVPDREVMAGALQHAVQEYQEPQQKPVPRPRPVVTAEQDQFITRTLWEADVDPRVFRVSHDPRKFLRGDGTLDETKLAAAIVATANMINNGGR